MEGYGHISWPLTQQLKRDSFLWTAEADSAFQQLKRAMTEVPVLALPDFTQLFVVESDVSGFGIGAVLMQNQQPIAYFSQVISSRARDKSVYDRNLRPLCWLSRNGPLFTWQAFYGANQLEKFKTPTRTTVSKCGIPKVVMQVVGL